MSFPMKPPLCFLVGPWDKLNRGLSNHRAHRAEDQQIHQRSHIKRIAQCQRYEIRWLAVKEMGLTHFHVG